MRKPSPYEKAILDARSKLLVLSDSQESMLDEILHIALGDINTKFVTARDEDLARLKWLQATKADLERIIDDLSRRFGDRLQQTLMDSISITTEGQQKAQTLWDAAVRQYLPEHAPIAFGGVPERALRATLARTFDDGLKLSNRIWNLGEHTKREVAQLVGVGQAEGWGPQKLAREITRQMVEKGGKRGAWKKNALRLARTELGHSAREAHLLCAQESPAVLGVKWNLSASHPEPDICDTWATQNLHGMGAGIYDINKLGDVPIDHPNGFCYLTDVLMPIEEYVAGEQEKALEFAPAKSVEAAQDWAKEQGIKADYTELTPRQCNAINRSIWEAKQRGGQMPESVISSRDEMKRTHGGWVVGDIDSIAMTAKDGKAIVINPRSYYLNPRSPESAEAERQRWFVDGSTGGLMRHELAHLHHRKLVLDTGASQSEWMALGKARLPITRTLPAPPGQLKPPNPEYEAIADEVSLYAMQSNAEFVAEVVTGVTDGREYSEKVKELFKSALGGAEWNLW